MVFFRKIEGLLMSGTPAALRFIVGLQFDDADDEGGNKHMSNNLLSKDLNRLEHPIDFDKLEHRPCLCGGRVYRFELATRDQWICNNCCGAAGDTYEEAVREKIKLDLVRVRDKAANFIEGIYFSK